MPYCSTCRYFVPRGSTIIGSCHFNPPVVVISRTSKTQWQELPEYAGKFPDIRPDNWCGKHAISNEALAKVLIESEKLKISPQILGES